MLAGKSVLEEDKRFALDRALIWYLRLTEQKVNQ